jgi:N-acylglucosamine-6-phosphate 2-epimerase
MNPTGFVFTEWLPVLRGKLVVSCQAQQGEPLYGSSIMARMAVAAQMGGAVAIRANSPRDIRSIRRSVALPIIGLYKAKIPGYEVYITPTVKHACQVAAAGADIISIDATRRERPEGLPLAEFIRRIKAETGCAVLADISTVDEAVRAEESGADMVASTLSGYTSYSPQSSAPDLELVAQIARRVKIPALAEGRYACPDQVVEANRLGAFAVIVGGAITRPAEITARFVRAMENAG